MSEISKFILAKRKASGLSQKGLSRICGVSDSEILKIETGERKRPNWFNLLKIARAIHIHPLEIMLVAGYIKKDDVNPAVRLSGLDKLTNEELLDVQQYIDFLNFKRGHAPSMQFRLGELFCGPGGLAWGALHADIGNSNFKIIHQWANDYDESTCETYRHNICPETPQTVYCDDIRKFDLKKLAPIDVLAFGFPCNDFSVVGEQKGISGNYGPLYTYGVKALKLFKPQWFLAENVGGLQTANEGKTFAKILEELRKAGYTITPHLYKFEEYGIPQSRHRIIIIGIRNDINITYKVPSPEPYKGIDNSCRKAIEEPPIPPDAQNNEMTKQSPTVIRRLEHILPGQNAFNADLPDDLKLNVKGAKISQIYKRLDPAKPSYTVTGSGGGGTHIYHWSEPRALTNRERARLQTFPDTFEFKGNKENVRRQIGMAVPCKGAQIIFEAVLKCFAGIEYPHIEANINE